jgi:hypothetical protein
LFLGARLAVSDLLGDLEGRTTAVIRALNGPELAFFEEMG